MEDEYRSHISLSTRIHTESYTMTTASNHSLTSFPFRMMPVENCLLMQYIQQVKENMTNLHNFKCDLGHLGQNFLFFFPCWIQAKR